MSQPNSPRKLKNIMTWEDRLYTPATFGNERASMCAEIKEQRAYIAEQHARIVELESQAAGSAKSAMDSVTMTRQDRFGFRETRRAGGGA